MTSGLVHCPVHEMPHCSFPMSLQTHLWGVLSLCTLCFKQTALPCHYINLHLGIDFEKLILIWFIPLPWPDCLTVFHGKIAQRFPGTFSFVTVFFFFHPIFNFHHSVFNKYSLCLFTMFSLWHFGSHKTRVCIWTISDYDVCIQEWVSCKYLWRRYLG